MEKIYYKTTACWCNTNYQFPISVEIDALFHKLEPLIISIPLPLMHSHNLTNQPNMTSSVQLPITLSTSSSLLFGDCTRSKNSTKMKSYSTISFGSHVN